MLALPFEDDTFDCSRSKRVFRHLVNPDGALAEMVRVTNPRGRIVIMELDRGSFSFDSDEIDIERRLLRISAEHFIRNGYSGHQLYRRFRQQRLVDIAIEVHPQVITSYAAGRRIAQLDLVEPKAIAAGIVTESEVKRWHTSLEQADSASGYFQCLNMVIVAGRKA